MERSLKGLVPVAGPATLGLLFAAIGNSLSGSLLSHPPASASGVNARRYARPLTFSGHPRPLSGTIDGRDTPVRRALRGAGGAAIGGRLAFGAEGGDTETGQSRRTLALPQAAGPSALR